MLLLLSATLYTQTYSFDNIQFLFATTFKYHQHSQIIEYTVKSSLLSEKLMSAHAR